jgi:hypothetical protein
MTAEECAQVAENFAASCKPQSCDPAEVVMLLKAGKHAALMIAEEIRTRMAMEDASTAPRHSTRPN